MHCFTVLVFHKTVSVVGHQQSKSGGAAEVFFSHVTEEESKLFQVVQTIAEEVSQSAE